MAGVIDLYLAYRFLRNLVQPFDKWQAYETGVIDKYGNILVSKQDRTQEQKYSLGYFDIISMNLKKLLGKLPGGKSAIASYAAALLLLKEYDKVKDIREDFLPEQLDMEKLEIAFMNCMEEVEAMFADINEDMAVAPTNAVTADVAGLGVGPKGEPPIDKARLGKKKKPLKRFDEYNEVNTK